MVGLNGQPDCDLLLLLPGCTNFQTGSLAAGMASSGTACANLGRSSATERVLVFLSVSICNCTWCWQAFMVSWCTQLKV